MQDILHRIDLTDDDVTLSMSLENVTAQLSDGATGHTRDGWHGNIDAPSLSAHDIDVRDIRVHDTLIRLTIQLKLKRRGVETKLVLGGDTPALNLDQKTIKMIARAHIWFQQLSNGTVKSVRQIAEREKCDASEISRVMPLAFLAPDIVTAILAGRQPVDLTADRLKRMSLKLPIRWEQQKSALGFTD